MRPRIQSLVASLEVAPLMLLEWATIPIGLSGAMLLTLVPRRQSLGWVRDEVFLAYNKRV